jgi:hypothetical protein
LGSDTAVTVPFKRLNHLSDGSAAKRCYVSPRNGMAGSRGDRTIAVSVPDIAAAPEAII